MRRLSNDIKSKVKEQIPERRRGPSNSVGWLCLCCRQFISIENAWTWTRTPSLLTCIAALPFRLLPSAPKLRASLPRWTTPDEFLRRTPGLPARPTPTCSGRSLNPKASQSGQAQRQREGHHKHSVSVQSVVGSDASSVVALHCRHTMSIRAKCLYHNECVLESCMNVDSVVKTGNEHRLWSFASARRRAFDRVYSDNADGRLCWCALFTLPYVESWSARHFKESDHYFSLRF